MKFRLLTSALLLTAVTAAPASAMVSSQQVDAAINASVFNSELSSHVDGDTVTIFGMVQGAYEANKVRQAALNIEGVNKVISRFSAHGAGI